MECVVGGYIHSVRNSSTAPHDEEQETPSRKPGKRSKSHGGGRAKDQGYRDFELAQNRDNLVGQESASLRHEGGDNLG
jgi:hypothetical protein